jgi:hypothetical protein
VRKRKIEDRHFIRMTPSGDYLVLSQSEYEPSLEEWHRRRTEAFAELRKDGFIPGELLGLVENFKEQTRVQLFVRKLPVLKGLNFGIKLAGNQTDPRLADMTADSERTEEDSEKGEITASEALAFLLRILLRDLQHAMRDRKAAPVRHLNHLPRSLMAEIAMDLLQNCETWGRGPGPWLSCLIRELLDLAPYRQGMSREVEVQEVAARIIAQRPDVGTRELARDLDVNASTISRWRRSSKFKEMVERRIAVAKKLKKTDLHSIQTA